jgi:hypothetical protein
MWVLLPLAIIRHPTPIVGILLNPPIVKNTVAQAKRVLNDIAGNQYDCKLAAFERTIALDSNVDNTNTAYKSMSRLWSDTLNETQGLESEHRVIAALMECGDFIHDYLLPYSDQISSRFHMNIQAFHTRWIQRGGAGNPNTSESQLVYQTCRQVNPFMTQSELAQENVKIQTLMTIYSDRCQRCHNSVRHLDEQEYWNFLRDTETKVMNDHYVFQNPATAKLYIIRAIQTERDRHYNWVGAALQYTSNGRVVQP